MGLCLGEVGALGRVVRFDLRLGAGGTDHDGLAVLKAVGEDVGLRESGLFGFQVVGDLCDRDARDVFRGFLAERGHHAGHLVHTGEAGELEGVDLVEVTAVLGVDLLKTLLDGGADASVVSGHLADEHGGDDGVLVADVRAGQVAVGLFEAEDEALDFPVRLEGGDLVADPLEAREGLSHLDAVVLGHEVGQRRGDDGLAGDGSLGHGAFFEFAGADVV